MILTRFLKSWRTIPLRDREVVDGLVDPAHAGPPGSAELDAALQSWAGTYYWSDEPDGRHVILTRPMLPRPRERWVLHAVLFLATLFTATLAGAMMSGPVAGWSEWGVAFLRDWSRGLTFSLPLLAILMCHELGHYLTARRYQLDVSPPYFLPAPPVVVWIGTLGAFIRLRTILSDRRQLIDVGAAGPFAGIVVAIPVFWAGLTLSQPIAEGAAIDGWALGDSLLTLAMQRLAFGDADVVLHPTAFAGWFGLLVTAINLLPMAQLDGGHILYAALPAWHERIARGFWIAVLALGWWYPGWLVFALLVLVLSRGQLGHPPVLDAYRPLPPARRWLAWASLLLFLVTFTPTPFLF